MRDRLKDMDYWSKNISLLDDLRQRRYSKFQNELIVEDRINIVKQDMVGSYLRSIKSKYSTGYPPQELKQDLICAINLTDESWDGAWKIYYKGKYLNQLTLDAYDQMLWMLSLGYLLGIPNEIFQKLVGVIDRYHVKDFLFEFIILAKIKERQPIAEESYQHFFGIPNTFSTLRQAITKTNTEMAEALVRQFVTKEWYKKHKDAGWHNNHKSPHDVYSGYWCFEAAAVVKIMGLDDSSFRDSQYYPKDLVNVKI